MTDAGVKETDELLKNLEERIRKEYGQANREVSRKLNDYMSKFAKQDREHRRAFERGEISLKEYNDWRVGKYAVGKRWEAMRDEIAHDYHNANKLARHMVKGEAINAYAINHNYETFKMEKGLRVDSSFTLYDRSTVARLMIKNPSLLKGAREGSKAEENKAENKDLRWNNTKVNSAIIQGILQGEGVKDVAKRLSKVCKMNEGAAIRYARTAVTSAQNSGRLDSLRRSADLGIEAYKVWMATLDDRTRPSHRDMDGEEAEIEEEFSNGLMYPGDPDGDADEVWNCRCSMTGDYKGYKTNFRDLRLRNSDKIGKMSYEEWKETRGEKREYKGKGVSDKAGGKSKAEKLGVLKDTSEETVKTMLDLAQENYESLNYEKCIVITDDGTVWEVEGNAYSVDPNEIPVSRKGAYSYHNHSIEETHYSFGQQDAGDFIESKEKYSRASDHLYEYEMRRTKDTIDARYGQVVGRFGEIQRDIVMEMSKNNRIDPNYDEYHEVMKVLSEEYKFEYNRRKKGK